MATSHQYYESITDIPIGAWFAFNKYHSLITVLYVDHAFYADVLRQAGKETDAEIIELNAKFYSDTLKAGIDLFAFCCLCMMSHVSNYSDRHLLTLQNQHFEEGQAQADFEKLAAKYKRQLIDYDFQDGITVQGLLLTVEEFNRFDNIKRRLAEAIAAGYDLPQFFSIMEDVIEVQAGHQLETSVEKTYRKALVLLQKEGYKINTVFDYYTALELVKESKPNDR